MKGIGNTLQEERRMNIDKILAFLAGTFLVAGVAMAQEPIVYPAKGQSHEQMQKDEFECYQWAKGQTGFDPMAPPTPSTPPPQQQAPTSSVGKSAVGGAALGSLIGGIADGNWGHGAAYGAIAGGLFGGYKKHEQQKANTQEQEQWQQQQAQQYQQQRNTYNRAYAACLEGRGYTVN
jgi:hypothetical protein